MKLFAKILEQGVLLFFIVWFFLVVVDYSHVKKGESATFCTRMKTYTYDDGTVDECLGLGYKVFTYKRKSINNLIEFVPSWNMPKEKAPTVNNNDNK